MEYNKSLNELVGLGVLAGEVGCSIVLLILPHEGADNRLGIKAAVAQLMLQSQVPKLTKRFNGKN